VYDGPNNQRESDAHAGYGNQHHNGQQTKRTTPSFHHSICPCHTEVPVPTIGTGAVLHEEKSL